MTTTRKGSFGVNSKPALLAFTDTMAIITGGLKTKKMH
jgi:hypothetical protein